jgi:hypothetical protein
MECLLNLTPYGCRFRWMGNLIAGLSFLFSFFIWPLPYILWSIMECFRSGFLVVINDAACWSVNSSPTLTDTHLLTGHALGFS